MLHADGAAAFLLESQEAHKDTYDVLVQGRYLDGEWSELASSALRLAAC